MAETGASSHQFKIGLGRAKSSPVFTWQFGLVIAWLSFSIALASWWVVFGIRQIDRLFELASGYAGSPETPALAQELARQHRMLLSEGVTLILLLLIGGAGLVYYILTEVRRTQRVREFFGAFTHDLKTSLASLRLQAESLEEDLSDRMGDSKLLKRLIRDTVRLELQLENSLLLASPDDSSRFLLEPVDLAEQARSMVHQWPDLQLDVRNEAKGIFALVDLRATESIFKNLLQNSVIHGRAKKAVVSIRAKGEELFVVFEDDGRGFQGDTGKLGRIFERHGSTSGSGLGLYLASRLAKTMRGSLRILGASEGALGGFAVELRLPVDQGNVRESSREVNS